LDALPYGLGHAEDGRRFGSGPASQFLQAF
jgi:hypothetical protein